MKFPNIYFQQDDGGGGESGTGDPGAGSGDNAGADNWMDGLPEEVRDWDEVKNSKDPETFWKQMGDMRSHLGQSIRIPSEEAGTEDWNKFHEKLKTKVPDLIPKPVDEEGRKRLYEALRPEASDKYTIPEIDDKGMKISMEEAEAFKEIAFELGLSQDQYNGIVAKQSERNINNAIEIQQGKDQDFAKLSDEWGAALEQNIKMARSVAEKTNAPPALLSAIDANAVDSATLKWLHSLSKSLGPEGTNLVTDKGDPSLLPPAEAQNRINEILNNKEHAYWIHGHPQHQQAIKEMLRLQKLANPGASDDINMLRSGGISPEGAAIFNR